MRTHRLYLLHLTYPGGAVDHYLGITHAGNLSQRMKDHRRRRGAKLTKEAVAQGASLDLVRTWPCDGFEDETRALKSWWLPGECPICSPQLRITTLKHYPARRMFASLPTGWGAGPTKKAGAD